MAVFCWCFQDFFFRSSIFHYSDPKCGRRINWARKIYVCMLFLPRSTFHWKRCLNYCDYDGKSPVCAHNNTCAMMRIQKKELLYHNKKTPYVVKKMFVSCQKNFFGFSRTNFIFLNYDFFFSIAQKNVQTYFSTVTFFSFSFFRTKLAHDWDESSEMFYEKFWALRIINVWRGIYIIFLSIFINYWRLAAIYELNSILRTPKAIYFF